MSFLNPKSSASWRLWIPHGNSSPRVWRVECTIPGWPHWNEYIPTHLVRIGMWFYVSTYLILECKFAVNLHVMDIPYTRRLLWIAFYTLKWMMEFFPLYYNASKIGALILSIFNYFFDIIFIFSYFYFYPLAPGFWSKQHYGKRSI